MKAKLISCTAAIFLLLGALPHHSSAHHELTQNPTVDLGALTKEIMIMGPTCPYCGQKLPE